MKRPRGGTRQETGLDLASTRLDPYRAKKLIGEIVRHGRVGYFDHCRLELEHDDLTTFVPWRS